MPCNISIIMPIIWCYGKINLYVFLIMENAIRLRADYKPVEIFQNNPNEPCVSGPPRAGSFRGLKWCSKTTQRSAKVSPAGEGCATEAGWSSPVTEGHPSGLLLFPMCRPPGGGGTTAPPHAFLYSRLYPWFSRLFHLPHLCDSPDNPVRLQSR